jgi:peptidoglycan/xylan/chitin deacetylase (PgdA/CDA1 family)
MRALKGIQFLFSSRGIHRWFYRLRTVWRRFGFTPAKQMNIIYQYTACLKKYGVQGTFFIPAVLLKRYASWIKKIDHKTIEWGIHGHVHTDHANLSYEEQKEQIAMAVKTFDECDVEFKGFRCPYLHFNAQTHQVLEENPRFLFDSSYSVVWKSFYSEEEYKSSLWIRDFYRPAEYRRNSLIPYSHGFLTEIPVSLPDDDVLVDRDHLDANEIFGIWEKILHACHKNNEVFVLQLHPERFLELKVVVEYLIHEAKSMKPPMWITTLSEVASIKRTSVSFQIPAPYQGAFCITGDIDAITISDFLRRLKDW